MRPYSQAAARGRNQIRMGGLLCCSARRLRLVCKRNDFSGQGLDDGEERAEPALSNQRELVHSAHSNRQALLVLCKRGFQLEVVGFASLAERSDKQATKT